MGGSFLDSAAAARKEETCASSSGGGKSSYSCMDGGPPARPFSEAGEAHFSSSS